MAVFMLDDVAGGVEVVVVPGDVRASTASLIESGRMVLVRGKLEKDDESARLVATETACRSPRCRSGLTREVAIHLSMPPHGRPTFEALAELFSRHRGDRRVSLELDVNGQPRAVARARRRRADRVRPSRALVAEVEQICGAGIGGASMMR